MPRPETDIRVSDDPTFIATVRAAARRTAEDSEGMAIAQVKAGDYVDYRAWDRLKEKPGEAWTAVRAVLDDPAATPAGKANAAIRLREFGDPAGEAYLVAALSDPSPVVRSAALEKLWTGDGDQVDMTTQDRRTLLLDLIDDPDPAVARNAHLAALWWRQLPGAADRVAARVAAGTAPNLREWAVHLAGRAEAPSHVRIALPHVFPPDDADFASGWYPSDLQLTLAHSDPGVREPVRRGLLDYCLRFRDRRVEQGYVSTLALVADETTIPLLEEIADTADDPFAQTYALGAIARLRPAEAIDRILAHAAQAGRWTHHPEMLAKYATEADAGRVLATLGPTALGQGDYSIEHLIRLCLSAFGEAGRLAVEGWLPKLSLRTRAVAVWGLQRIDLRAALEAFAAAGLLPVPPDEVYEATRRLKEENEGRGSFDPTAPRSLTEALSCVGIVVSFDAESDQLPSPHDELVMRFGRHSRGGFAPECAVQIPGEDEPDDEEGEFDASPGDAADSDEFDPEGPLRVQFIHAGRVYEFDPENFGDWYDVSAVAAAVNRAVADAGRSERFISIETGGQSAEFVFADPARFLPVAGRFAVPIQDDAARRG